MVREKRDGGGGDRAVIVHMPVLSRPHLINIPFTLEFYSPSFSISCFPEPETYCISGKHSRKYGINNQEHTHCSNVITYPKTLIVVVGQETPRGYPGTHNW